METNNLYKVTEPASSAELDKRFFEAHAPGGELYIPMHLQERLGGNPGLLEQQESELPNIPVSLAVESFVFTAEGGTILNGKDTLSSCLLRIVFAADLDQAASAQFVSHLPQAGCG